MTGRPGLSRQPAADPALMACRERQVRGAVPWVLRYNEIPVKRKAGCAAERERRSAASPILPPG